MDNYLALVLSAFIKSGLLEVQSFTIEKLCVFLSPCQRSCHTLISTGSGRGDHKQRWCHVHTGHDLGGRTPPYGTSLLCFHSLIRAGNSFHYFCVSLFYKKSLIFLTQANTILPHSHSHHLHCLPTLMNMAASFDITSEKRLWVPHPSCATDGTGSVKRMSVMCYVKQLINKRIGTEIVASFFFRRASAAVNYLKWFHEKKKRGAKPYSLYLDHILRTSGASHCCQDRHFRPQRDIFIVKVHKWHHVSLQCIFNLLIIVNYVCVMMLMEPFCYIVYLCGH